MSFWGELKRRNVYKVGVAYAIVAWLLIQFAAIAFPHLGFPSWAVPFVIVILIIGFPIALLLAWAYEVTPEGIKRTKEVPLSESITHLTGKKLNYILAGLLILAIAFLLFDNYYLDRRAIEQEVSSNETKQAPVVDVEEAPKTIAVLPFDDLSPEKDQEYFVLGLSEEILNSLAQIADLTVIAKTSSFSFRSTNKTIQEIASVLGVENILEGSVRKAGNDLRITAQLVKAVDGSHLWSNTYDKEFKVEEMFSVQEDIAIAVANELKVKFGIGKSLKKLGGTENVEAYELYLKARGQMWSYDPVVMNRNMELLDAAIDLDPKFALAWVIKSQIHGNLTTFGPSNQANMEQDAALSAALKGIELEPNLAEGYIRLGWVKGSKCNWIEAESAYRKFFELQTEKLSGSEALIAIHYEAVGNTKRANELLEEMRQNDPLHEMVRDNYIFNFTYLGDMQRAEEDYKRGRELFGDQWGNRVLSQLRLFSGDIVSPNDIVYSDPIWDSAKKYFDSPEKALAELRRISSDDDISVNYLQNISIWSAYFGDPAFAMDAIEKAANLEAVSLFSLWFPIMKEVRQTSRFKEFVREIGLVDYWNKFGWPDICHELDNGDFECD